MDTTTFDLSTLTLLAAILGSTVGSTMTIITLMLRQINRLDTKFDTKIDALDTKFTNKIDALDTKFTNKIDALGDKFDTKIESRDRVLADIRERLARIEGHLLGLRAPRTGDVHPSTSHEPTLSEPGPANPVDPTLATPQQTP